MKINIIKILSEFLGVAKKHPCEMLLMIIATLPFFIFDLYVIELYFAYYAFSAICFSATYLLNGTRIYKFSPLFVCCFYIFLYINNERSQYFLWDNYVKLIMLHIVFILAMLSRSFSKDDAEFINFALKTMASIVYAVVVSLGIYVIICSFVVSTEYLFGLDFIWDVYPRLFFILFFSVFPMLFLYFESKIHNLKVGFIFKILLDIIGVSLIIYTILLYAYMLYIVFNAELPRGKLSFIIIPYMYASILLYMLRPVYVGRFELYRRWFGLISIAPLVMLFVGVLRRISDYGYTIDRFYLLSFSVLTLLLCFLCMFKFRLRNFSFVTILVILFLIFGVDANRIAYDSQNQKLNEILARFDALEANGTIKSSFNIQDVYKKSNESEKKDLSRVKNISYEIYAMDQYNIKRDDESAFRNLIWWSEENHEYVSHIFSLEPSDEFVFDADYERMIYITNAVYNDNNASTKDLILRDNDRQIIFAFEGDEFINEIFSKNNLDINKTYQDDELNKYKNDFLGYQTSNGTLFFSNVTIEFDTGIQRYRFSSAYNGIFIQKRAKNK